MPGDAVATPTVTPAATLTPAAPSLNLDPSQLDAARKAGYSDDEILQHLSQTRGTDFSTATKAGYSSTEILSHMSSLPAAQAAPKLTVRKQAIADAKAKTAGMTQEQKNAYETQEFGKQMKDPINPVNLAGAALGGEAVEGAIPLAEEAGPALKVATRAIGGALGGGGTTGAQTVAGQVASGQNPVAPAQLKETAKNTAIGAGIGAGVGTVAGGLEVAAGEKAASSAAAQAVKDKAAQEATQATQDAATASQALRDNARKAANLASKAADDGIQVDAGKSVYSQFVTKAAKVDRDEFMSQIQPILEKARVDSGIANIAKADPTEVLKYRDAVDTALAGPKYEAYRQPILDAITQDLNSEVKGNKYPGFKNALSKITPGNSVLKLASKLGNSADDVAASLANKGNTHFEIVPHPDPSEIPSIEEVDGPIKKVSKAVAGFAKKHPYLAIGAGGAAGAIGGSLGKKLLSTVMSVGGE
jgi:hypothetical protein